jgi:hypothetical protein
MAGRRTSWTFALASIPSAIEEPIFCAQNPWVSGMEAAPYGIEHRENEILIPCPEVPDTEKYAIIEQRLFERNIQPFAFFRLQIGIAEPREIELIDGRCPEAGPVAPSQLGAGLFVKISARHTIRRGTAEGIIFILPNAAVPNSRSQRLSLASANPALLLTILVGMVVAPVSVSRFSPSCSRN